MAVSPTKHKQPIMGLLSRPYKETCMNGRKAITRGGLFVKEACLD